MNVDPTIINIAGTIFTIVGAIVTATWRVSGLINRRFNAMSKMMADHETADTQRFAAAHVDLLDLGEDLRKSIGETGAAIRQKIYEVEMWNRDNLVHKDGLDDRISQQILQSRRKS